MRTIILFVILLITGCNPDFLDVKRDMAQAVPTSLEDFEGLMRRAEVFNSGGAGSMGIVGSDEVLLTDDNYSLLINAYEKNAYIWEPDVYGVSECEEWNIEYRRIIYTNVVLEGLARLKDTISEKERYMKTKGAAYFCRAFSHYQIAQLFGAPYGVSNLEEYGIPLRLESDPTMMSKRATVEETYNQIVSDLKNSVYYLPNKQENAFFPSKRAAKALLARIYLIMGNWELANRYATEVIGSGVNLMDYNDVVPRANYSFPYLGTGNPEVLFFDTSGSSAALNQKKLLIPEDIFKLYSENDLRKKLFFMPIASGGVTFKGNYTGLYLTFSGLSLDEIYLIQSESNIRLNKVELGIETLKKLLVTRMVSGTYITFPNLDQDAALQLVLRERQKQLLLRDIRWSDLRRLNQVPKTAVTINRIVNGVSYKLLPNDLRYTLQMPKGVLDNADVRPMPR